MNTKTITCCLLFLIAAACSVSNQNASLETSIDIAEPYELYLQTEDTLISIRPDSAGAFFCTFACDSSYFAFIQGVIGEKDNQRQCNQPLFITPGQTIQVGLGIEDQSMQINVPRQDNNNQALNEYEQFCLQHKYQLWTATPSATEATRFLEQFQQQAKAIIEKYQPTAKVRQYIDINAYLNYMTGVDNLRFIYRNDTTNRLPQGLKSSLPAPEQLLDNPTALLFYDVVVVIHDYLNNQTKTPEECLQLLHQKFHYTPIVQQVTYDILEKYISSYDYTQNFDEGLTRLQKMCSTLPDQGVKYIQSFEAKRYSVEGAPLPEASLKDRKGKTYKLSDFKGKYLYIDLWASWCVPCCEEVPHLQKLEKLVKNKQVEFISISIDTNPQDWYKRMKQLHMEGNQYLAEGKELLTMLNVQEIPHFLIYGKDGRLLQYKAPRPSTGKALQQLLENLK